MEFGRQKYIYIYISGLKLRERGKGGESRSIEIEIPLNVRSSLHTEFICRLAGEFEFVSRDNIQRRIQRVVSFYARGGGEREAVMERISGSR